MLHNLHLLLPNWILKKQKNGLIDFNQMVTFMSYAGYGYKGLSYLQDDKETQIILYFNNNNDGVYPSQEGVKNVSQVKGTLSQLHKITI